MELTYRAFGLTIASELVLPGLPTSDGKPEVFVRRALVPEWNGETTIRYGERCQIHGQRWSIRFKALPFTSLISDGKLVQFEADPAQDEVSSLHVLGSCTGALLFQRGLTPLHGNTVVTPHGTAMIVGRVGAGKSATTFELLRRQNRLLADDISAVSTETSTDGVAPSEPYVASGFPRIKLWKATLDHFGCKQSDFSRLRPGIEKFHYPVGELFCAEPQKLTAIYVLQATESPAVRLHALSGLAKLAALRSHLYKIRFPDAVRNWPQLLAKVCRLADAVRVNIIERPREGNSIEAVADVIEQDLLRAPQNPASGA